MDGDSRSAGLDQVAADRPVVSATALVVKAATAQR
jgi:hypothetical protein